MKSRFTPLIVLSLAVLTPACGPEEALEAVVSPVRAPCVRLTYGYCLRSAENGSEEKIIDNGYEGFTHRWGVETHLLYHVGPVEGSTLDGPDQRWYADEIVSETRDPVGTQYTINFPEAAPDAWFVASGERLLMIDTEVDCAPQVCADLLDRSAAGATFSATFELTADEAVPLRLLSLD
ncbi:hypothetical protein [Nannocystis sp. SCPEA4]|uniref:hypothetical protein n=1 Tax=Nannocystis sp. SCPEA4 TaxID=2996787 RepID=UPI0022704661|nr:hypothetical protein [Nannocystis sp. SCPEA4]MCY1055372.1 hypothetical protein [Nannocystis sp. SCPEA4]